jgi:hypothetical protein
MSQLMQENDQTNSLQIVEITRKKQIAHQHPNSRRATLTEKQKKKEKFICKNQGL